ncbi:HNH endonuclease signature motif containing protein [Ursidibacter arcticus]
MPKRKRDYDKEYNAYHGTPEQIANRSKRNKARRLMEKELGKSAIAGKEIDHKKPLSKGGSNSRGNLQVMSKTANRKKGNK